MQDALQAVGAAHPHPGPRPPRPEKTRRFTFESRAVDVNGQPYGFDVIRVRGEEGISMPYRFELLLMSARHDVQLEEVLQANATFAIHPPYGRGAVAPYHGCLAEFEQLQEAGKYCFYRAVLVPHLWTLSVHRRSDLFLKQSIPDTISAVLKAGGLQAQSLPPDGDGAQISAPAGFAMYLHDRSVYAAHGYVCQYQETSLDFVSRWMEREGIYYHFEHDRRADSELLVLLDDLNEQRNGPTLNYLPGDGVLPPGATAVRAFTCRVRPAARSAEVRSFDEQRAGTAPQMAVYPERDPRQDLQDQTYGEEIRDDAQGARYARVRAQALSCTAKTFYGESDAVGIRSGRTITLNGHFRAEYNGQRYLVTEITHEGDQADLVPAGVRIPGHALELSQQSYYGNRFVAVPAQTQYRAPQSTPRPTIAGTMSATIDGSPDDVNKVRADAEEAAKKENLSEAEVTEAGNRAVQAYQPDYADVDAQGRYRVCMPFTRARSVGAGSAYIRLASTYAGDAYGLHCPLLKGTEVLLAFLGGDPDQPVIVGAVHNSTHRNVVTDANRRQNVLTTKGGNQLVLDDTVDAQSVWLYSPNKKSQIVLGNAVARPGGIERASTMPAITPAPMSEAEKLGKSQDEIDQETTARQKAADKQQTAEGGAGMVLATDGSLLQYAAKATSQAYQGPKVTQAIGTSVDMSLSTKVSAGIGFSLGMDMSWGIKWSVGASKLPEGPLTPLAQLLGPRSISVNDSDDFKVMQKDSKQKAFGELLLSAGEVSPADTTSYAESKTFKYSMLALRGLVATAVGVDCAVQAAMSKNFSDTGKGELNNDLHMGLAAAVPVVSGMLTKLLARSDKINMVSKMSMGATGITQTVNGDARTGQRARIQANNQSIQLRIGDIAHWSAPANTAAATSQLDLGSGMATLDADVSVDLRAKDVTLSSSAGTGAVLKVSQGTAQQIQMSSGTTSLTLTNSKLSGIASSVQLGVGLVQTNPRYALALAQRTAALIAQNTADNAVETQKALIEGLTDGPAKDAAKLQLDALVVTQTAAREAFDRAYEALQGLSPNTGEQLNNGLLVSAAKTTLQGGGSAVDLSATAAVMGCGGAELKLSPAGLTASGTIVKLG